MVDQCFIVRFEKRAREFWSLARLTIQLGSRRETDCPQILSRDKVCSPGVNGADTRSRSIYA